MNLNRLSKLWRGCIWILVLVASISNGDEFPDLRSVAADLNLPALDVGPARAGKRVKCQLDGESNDAVYSVLYLPTDWTPEGEWPVLVEFAGNGGYSNAFGDISTGRPEGSRLGYGLSGGTGAIWICLPYLRANGNELALTWWGDPPQYDPQPTLDYCQRAIDMVCDRYGGDPNQLVLCGFSRGAIACNFLGLHDDSIAARWCGFFCFSHYDGVRQWPYPASDRPSALTRLRRLRDRPQFICGEGKSVEATQAYLKEAAPNGRFEFASTGFRNHSDEWILRPSPAREQARRWYREVVSPTK